MRIVSRRRYADLEITPALIATGASWRLQVLCGKCMVPRDVAPTVGERLARYWCTDMAKVRLRCRCGAYAPALHVTWPTRDARETLLLVSVDREHHG